MLYRILDSGPQIVHAGPRLMLSIGPLLLSFQVFGLPQSVFVTLVRILNF